MVTAANDGRSLVKAGVGCCLTIGAGLAVVVVLLRLTLPASYYDHDVVLRNESGQALDEVRFIAEQAHGVVEVIGEYADVRDGTELRSEFDRDPWFHLRVEITAGGHRHTWRNLRYIDADEWGDIELLVEPGLLMSGEPGEVESVKDIDSK